MVWRRRQEATRGRPGAVSRPPGHNICITGPDGRPDRQLQATQLSAVVRDQYHPGHRPWAWPASTQRGGWPGICAKLQGSNHGRWSPLTSPKPGLRRQLRRPFFDWQRLHGPVNWPGPQAVEGRPDPGASSLPMGEAWRPRPQPISFFKAGCCGARTFPCCRN